MAGTCAKHASDVLTQFQSGKFSYVHTCRLCCHCRPCMCVPRCALHRPGQLLTHTHTHTHTHTKKEVACVAACSTRRTYALQNPDAECVAVTHAGIGRIAMGVCSNVEAHRCSGYQVRLTDTHTHTHTHTHTRTHTHTHTHSHPFSMLTKCVHFVHACRHGSAVAFTGKSLALSRLVQRTNTVQPATVQTAVAAAG